MDRETKQVKLKRTGYVANIVTYFTRGEIKAIALARFAGATVNFRDGDVVYEKLSPNFVKLEEDEMMIRGINKLVDKEGKPVDVNLNTLDSLPDDDLEALITELQKVKNREDKEGKKNS